MSADQTLLVIRECRIERRPQRGHGRVAALGEAVMFDRAEDGLDVVELGAAGRQGVQVDVPGWDRSTIAGAAARCPCSIRLFEGDGLSICHARDMR